MANSEKSVLDRFKKRLNSLDYTSLDENKYDQTYFQKVGLTNVDVRPYQLHGIRWLIERYEAGHGASEKDRERETERRTKTFFI